MKQSIFFALVVGWLLFMVLMMWAPKPLKEDSIYVFKVLLTLAFCLAIPVGLIIATMEVIKEMIKQK